ncbi:MAG: hypothetical protein R3245_01090 [Kiloniellales bacterium]|nr:hypothetical protein [Kiloniellales bacterium]
MATSVSPGLEFSRLVPHRRLAKLPLQQTFRASRDECDALSRRFGLEALERLEAEVEVSPAREPGCIRVTGKLYAVVRQRCVVTLDTFAHRIEEPLDGLFALNNDTSTSCEVIDFTEEYAEPLDPIGLDVGELIAQHLSLALDAHPRIEGAEFEEKRAQPNEGGPDSPFVVLQQLKSGKD